MNHKQRQGLPRRLYKYRDTGKFTEAIFGTRTLYFAPPSGFNDPFDCGFRIAVTGSNNAAVTESVAWQAIKEKCPDMPPAEQIEGAKQVRRALLRRRRTELEDIVVEKLAKDTNARVGICCFSEVNDDILMWSHYSDCHRGICLEFSLVRGFLRAAQPVEYSRRYPSLDLASVVVDEDLRAAAPWMLRKAKHWSYEKEWRVLEFVNGPGTKPWHPSCLTGVIMGCRIPAKSRAKVEKWIGGWPSKVTVYQARQSRRSFGLEIVEI